MVNPAPTGTTDSNETNVLFPNFPLLMLLIYISLDGFKCVLLYRLDVLFDCIFL